MIGDLLVNMAQAAEAVNPTEGETVPERVEDLENNSQMLEECILEMSEIIYA